MLPTMQIFGEPKWLADGAVEDGVPAHSRLQCALQFPTFALYLFAIEVVERNGVLEAAYPAWEPELEALYELNYDNPLQSTTIDGRLYLIGACPVTA